MKKQKLGGIISLLFIIFIFQVFGEDLFWKNKLKVNPFCINNNLQSQILKKLNEIQSKIDNFDQKLLKFEKIIENNITNISQSYQKITNELNETINSTNDSMKINNDKKENFQANLDEMNQKPEKDIFDIKKDEYKKKLKEIGEEFLKKYHSMMELIDKEIDNYPKDRKFANLKYRIGSMLEKIEHYADEILNVYSISEYPKIKEN